MSGVYDFSSYLQRRCSKLHHKSASLCSQTANIVRLGLDQLTVACAASGVSFLSILNISRASGHGLHKQHAEQNCV